MKWLIVVVALLVASPVWAQQFSNPVWNKSVNNYWSVAAYERSGKFTNCSIFTYYRPTTEQDRKLLRAKEMAFILKQANDNGIGILVGSDDWTLTKDKVYAVKIDFDDGTAWFDLKLIGYKSFMEGWYTEDAARDFMKAMIFRSKLTVAIDNQSLGVFPLQGSAEAVNALYKCVEDRRNTASKSDTFGRSVTNSDTWSR